MTPELGEDIEGVFADVVQRRAREASKGSSVLDRIFKEEKSLATS